MVDIAAALDDQRTADGGIGVADRKPQNFAVAGVFCKHGDVFFIVAGGAQQKSVFGFQIAVQKQLEEQCNDEKGK